MRIGIWGDSITYGACDPEGLGWVGRLRKALFSEYESVSVYNRGISGNTSRDLLKRFPVELASLSPEIIVFAIGVNDTVYRDSKEHTEVSLTEFRENINELISTAKGTARKVYVIGLTDVTDELLQPFPWSSSGKCYANSVIQTFDETLKDAANDQGAEHIHMQGVLSNADLFDGIHPNAQGYERMFSHIRERISVA